MNKVIQSFENFNSKETNEPTTNFNQLSNCDWKDWGQMKLGRSWDGDLSSFLPNNTKIVRPYSVARSIKRTLWDVGS